MTTISVAALVACVGLQAGPSAHLPLVVARLTNGISTRLAHTGDTVAAVVVSSTMRGGEAVIPQGSIILGTVAGVHRVGTGFVHERSSIRLDFRHWQSPDGAVHALTARVVDVDNAREQVSADGRIIGILAAGGPPGFLLGMWKLPGDELFSRTALGLAGISGFIGQRLNMDPLGVMAVAALRMAIVPPAEPEIWFPAGTDLILAVSVPPAVSSPEEPEPEPPAPELVSWVAARPIETIRARTSEAGDVTNVVFLGSREQVVDAFAAAGWREAEPFSRHSAVRWYRAMSAQRGYPTAPMSTLMLGEHIPDLELEKSLNTVARRHHVRIWQEGTWQGREAWIGAGTHDIAVHLGSRGFTHSVDPRIDEERGRIIDDLSFAGCVEQVRLIARPDAAAVAGNRLTDGRLAVVDLRTCPAGAQEVHAPTMNAPQRLLRRVVLEARYSVFRGNIYYWSYRAGRKLWSATRRNTDAPAEADDDRTAAILTNVTAAARP